MLIFSQKSPDQNSEIAILFNIVKKLCLWGRLTTPQSPWEGLQVTNFDLCLHIVMVTGKCTDVFRGIFFCLGGRVEVGGGGVTREDLSMEKLLIGEETFNEGGAGFFCII